MGHSWIGEGPLGLSWIGEDHGYVSNYGTYKTGWGSQINISVVVQNSGSGSKCATEGIGEDINV